MRTQTRSDRARSLLPAFIVLAALGGHQRT
jgi:hypothetical protein